METGSDTLQPAAPLASAAGPAESLERMADAIQQTLEYADGIAARAADELGRTGLRGAEAHARLQATLDELPYVASCSALDDQGVLVTEAPAAFIRVEGVDLRAQEHVRRMLQTHAPLLSGAFRSVEGADGIALARPIFGTDGRFLGSVSLLARPSSVIGHAVKPAFPEGLPDTYVMQKDGFLLYDTDRDEIGRNVFADPRFTGVDELQKVVRRQSAEEAGSAEYLQNRVSWKTVALHGTEWRVTVAEPREARARPAARYDVPPVPIPAEVGLHSLIALVDGHLRRIADELGLIAAGEAFRSGEWARIEAPLRRVSEVNPPGVYFFAERDGSFWTLLQGRGTGSLAGRPYFRRVMRGETVVGELVVGKIMGRYEGVVAVPVRDRRGEVIGLLGGTMYLDALSGRLREQMGLGERLWFYAFDADRRLALYPDPERVFLTAGELGPEVEAWFAEMQARGEGVIRYTYEGRPRTLVFRRSPLTGWMFAFGFLGEREQGG